MLLARIEYGVAARLHPVLTLLLEGTSRFEGMASEEELEAQASDLRANITAQGGQVKALKDKVKEKKKAKVR